jgi:hypothetical protein
MKSILVEYTAHIVGKVPKLVASSVVGHRVRQRSLIFKTPNPLSQSYSWENPKT